MPDIWTDDPVKIKQQGKGSISVDIFPVTKMLKTILNMTFGLYFLHVIRITFSPARPTDIACFASFESSGQFSLFIIVSIFSVSEKKSLDSREYLNFAAFSDEANKKFKMKMDLHRCYKLK